MEIVATCLCRAENCPLRGERCHSLTGCGTHLCIVHDDLATDLWAAATERIVARELLFRLLWKLQRAPGGNVVPASLKANLKLEGRGKLAGAETCSDLWRDLRAALFAECRGT